MVRPWRLALLAALLIGGAPAAAQAQLFLASRPHPEFMIGPLIVRASVGPELGPVTGGVLWGLVVPPHRSATALEQDLYLLWPGAVAGEAGPAPRGAPPPLVEQRGVPGPAPRG